MNLNNLTDYQRFFNFLLISDTGWSIDYWMQYQYLLERGEAFEWKELKLRHAVILPELHRHYWTKALQKE